MFTSQLDDKRRRALIAVAALPAEHMTVPFEADESREYLTTALGLLPKDVYESPPGSWLATCAYSSLKEVADKSFVVSDVSSGSQTAQRFRAVQTALDPGAAREDAAALMVFFGAIDSLTIGSLGSATRGTTGVLVEGAPTRMVAPVTIHAAPSSSSARQSPRTSTPPTTARRGSPGRGSTRPFADWFRKNRQAYAGNWVALDQSGQLIDFDSTRLALQKRLRERNRLRGATIVMVPADSL